MTREAELETEIARLRDALNGVMRFTIDGTVECRGDKCRERWCISCNSEEDANAAVEEAYEAYGKVKEALSTPPSTTALQELIEKVERRTIERCALAANPAWFEDPCYIHTIIDAIRALPTGNFKLEDLT